MLLIGASCDLSLYNVNVNREFVRIIAYSMLDAYVLYIVREKRKVYKLFVKVDRSTCRVAGIVRQQKKLDGQTSSAGHARYVQLVTSG